MDRLWRAFFYSLAGLRDAYREEAAFRQELWLALVLLPFALWNDHPPLAKAMLAGSVLLVLIVELLNSGLEAVVDRISNERHPLSRKAKDVGSAAVLLALGLCALVWGLIWWG
ncbi:MAG: diacylglycerol kinase [Magnetococcales bacterium]|nr:diacylglycerol kinase [Magnetococcales bacterium]